MESLGRLNRLDDVERTVAENVDRELRRLASWEQGRTFARLERSQQHRHHHSRHHHLSTASAAKKKKRGSEIMGDHYHHHHHDDGYYGRGGEVLCPIEIRRHLIHLLHAFGRVTLRLTHLAQIMRHRAERDPTILASSSVMTMTTTTTMIVTTIKISHIIISIPPTQPRTFPSVPSAFADDLAGRGYNVRAFMPEDLETCRDMFCDSMTR